MEATVIEHFVASLTTKQKDILWKIVQEWSETAQFPSDSDAVESENPTVACVLESALDNS